MNIAISGSRHIKNSDYIGVCIQKVIPLIQGKPHFVIGCSKDFDAMCEVFLTREFHSFESVVIYNQLQSRSVLWARRHKMLEKSDALIAIFDNDSKGTRDLIDLFLEHQKIVYAFQDGNFEILGESSHGNSTL
jgi:hypothetical protein